MLARIRCRNLLHGTRLSQSLPLGTLVLAFAIGAPRAQGQTLFTVRGAAPSDIQTTVDAFRASLGTLNANVAGSFGTGRREINWDGVPDGFAAPNNLPANFFNVNSPRGVVFSTPGTGFQVSANSGSGTPVDFGNIDPSYTATFEPFSAPRLFTALGSNIVDVNFFVAGSTTAALTRGFGAVFSDVDFTGSTRIQFFGAGDVLLADQTVLGAAGSQSFSFLGVTFATPVVSRVRIFAGGKLAAPGSIDQDGSGDIVVMDDFIYGEPVAATATVPEPATLALVGSGLLAIGMGRRRRRA